MKIIVTPGQCLKVTLHESDGDLYFLFDVQGESGIAAVLDVMGTQAVWVKGVGFPGEPLVNKDAHPVNEPYPLTNYGSDEARAEQSFHDLMETIRTENTVDGEYVVMEGCSVEVQFEGVENAVFVYTFGEKELTLNTACADDVGSTGTLVREQWGEPLGEAPCSWRWRG